MGWADLPWTYDECRVRFAMSCHRAGVPITSYPMDVTGPRGQELTIDVAVVGDQHPQRALVVLSGVHGVEGFLGAALQCDLVDRLGARPIPAGTAVVVIHAVNPWGMAWWRRQNESNVDLNRNWARDDIDPPENAPYAAVHSLLVPDSTSLPSDESFLEPAAELLEEHGLVWMRDAVALGQYSHPDGLHYGGDRTQRSTSVLAAITDDLLGRVTRSMTVDLHTGHGAAGTYTLLSSEAPGSPAGEWLRTRFDPSRIEATVDNPLASTGNKVGQLGVGMSQRLPDGDHHGFTLEFGTVDEVEMVLAERSENWAYHRLDRSDPVAIDASLRHRACFTPDDPGWAIQAMEQGRVVLESAFAAILEP